MRPLASAMAEVSAVSTASAWGVPVMTGRPVGSESGAGSSAWAGSWMVPVAWPSRMYAKLVGLESVRMTVSASSLSSSLSTGTVTVRGALPKLKVSVPLVSV